MVCSQAALIDEESIHWPEHAPGKNDRKLFTTYNAIEGNRLELGEKASPPESPCLSVQSGTTVEQLILLSSVGPVYDGTRGGSCEESCFRAEKCRLQLISPLYERGQHEHENLCHGVHMGESFEKALVAFDSSKSVHSTSGKNGFFRHLSRLSKNINEMLF